MPKLFETSNDRLLGEVSQDDLDTLTAQIAAGPSLGDGLVVDNDTFLRLADAAASSTLLDAVKSALDLVGGKATLRVEAD